MINDTTPDDAEPGFRGFVIQAQSVPGGNLVGTLMPDTVQLQQYLDCPDSMNNGASVSAIANGDPQIHKYPSRL